MKRDPSGARNGPRVPPPLPPPLPPGREVPSRAPMGFAGTGDEHRAIWITATTLAMILLLLSLLWLVRGNGESVAGAGSGAVGNGASVLAGKLSDENGDGGEDPTTSGSGTDEENFEDEDSGAESTSASDDVSTQTSEPPSDASTALSADPGEDVASEGNSIEAESEFAIGESQLSVYRSPPRPLSAPPGGGITGPRTGDIATKSGMNPFIGEGKPAKSTVFVIDVSSSMQGPHRLDRVISALHKGLDHMDSKQSFCVLLFDQGYYVCPDPALQGLAKATRSNVQAAKHWLSGPLGGGGTDPLPAMQVALGIHPERIVLLSDGEFDPVAVDLITQGNHQNRMPSRIDCVGLEEVVFTLQEIAARNHGIYYQAR